MNRLRRKENLHVRYVEQSHTKLEHSVCTNGKAQWYVLVSWFCKVFTYCFYVTWFGGRKMDVVQIIKNIIVNLTSISKITNIFFCWHYIQMWANSSSEYVWMIVCVLMFVSGYICMCLEPTEVRKEPWIFWNWSYKTNVGHYVCTCWKLNLDFPQKQKMLLTLSHLSSPCSSICPSLLSLLSFLKQKIGMLW